MTQPWPQDKEFFGRALQTRLEQLNDAGLADAAAEAQEGDPRIAAAYPKPKPEAVANAAVNGGGGLQNVVACPSLNVGNGYESDGPLRAGTASVHSVEGAPRSSDGVSDGESTEGDDGSEDSDAATLSPPSEDEDVVGGRKAAKERRKATQKIISSLAQVDDDAAVIQTAGALAEEALVAEEEQRPNTAGDGMPEKTPENGSSYPDENLPPKIGISVPMLSVEPVFIRAVPPEPELLHVPPEALFDDIVRLEADRISKPELVQNLTVYDCLEQPQDDQPRQPLPPPLPTAPGAAVEELPPFYVPTGPEDHTLVFESRFESGNLRRAVKVYDFEYDLVLNPDYNTKSHTQWYFFRVANTRQGPEYRFNIINMMKPTSVYNEGMRPLMYSTIEAALRGIGWVRGSENIIYYQNGIRRKDKGGTNYYTLTFTVKFEHNCDMVYFAHCYPYSYTDLQKDLRLLESDPHMSRRFRRRKLCDTLAGNACDLITITSFCSEPAAIKQRRAVVITARVHPGESNASWVMKGMLDYLTGTSLDARILRDNFVFKIIPMLNPDGVIVGNYRCSLVGQDLNRQWGDPSRKLHPTIYFAKNMIRHLLEDREVILYVDIHGHSRKKNVFMYGNSESAGLREKIFPRLLCRSSDCFNFEDCCFKVQKSKESTARVVVYREFSVLNSFTLEASFCGADFGPLGDQHFTTRHLEEMGYMVCDAILDFCDPDQTKVMLVCKELQALFPDDGNSDDVSDSDVDEAALQRARRRAARLKKLRKEREKLKKKKKEKRRKPSPEVVEASRSSAHGGSAAVHATSSGSAQTAARQRPAAAGAGPSSSAQTNRQGAAVEQAGGDHGALEGDSENERSNVTAAGSSRRMLSVDAQRGEATETRARKASGGGGAPKAKAAAASAGTAGDEGKKKKKKDAKAGADVSAEAPSTQSNGRPRRCSDGPVTSASSSALQARSPDVGFTAAATTTHSLVAAYAGAAAPAAVPRAATVAAPPPQPPRPKEAAAVPSQGAPARGGAKRGEPKAGSASAA